uniref:UBX domain-containing protein n=1 Tax=Haemonchus contortus TaxID=6289 RepID=A0A7I4YYH3_HAECO
MSTGDGIDLTYLEEPPIAWPKSEWSQNKYQVTPSFKDHLPYFAGENARVKEVNMNCWPDYENNRSEYIVNVKWLDDDERAAERWRQLASLSSTSTSSSRVESYTTEMTTEATEPTVDDWLGSDEYEQENTSSLSGGDVGHGGTVPAYGSSMTDERFLNENRSAFHTTATSSGNTQNGFGDFAHEGFPEHPDLQSPVPAEMLSIRIIIIEKANSSIVRRKIDYEAASDECISSIYDVLEKNMPSLEKIQVYYSNKKIRRRTDLTKLPAGDRRQFCQLAGTQGSLVFVVAAPTVRIF